MKKNVWVLLLFVIIGLLAGTLLSRSLDSVSGLSFLTRTSKIIWSPNADLLAFSYSITITIKVSLLSIVGLIAAIWIYRKM